MNIIKSIIRNIIAVLAFTIIGMIGIALLAFQLGAYGFFRYIELFVLCRVRFTRNFELVFEDLSVKWFISEMTRMFNDMRNDLKGII